MIPREASGASLAHDRAEVIRLLALTALPVLLVISRMVYTGRLTYGPLLLWNLLLAWAPVGLAFLATRPQRSSRSLRLIFGMGWLLFLPNAPYLVTDIAHLHASSSVPIYFDVVLLYSAAFCGVALGCVSLRWMQCAVTHFAGLWPGRAFTLVAAIAAGFGVYLGRFLRWNSWDALLQPAAVAEDILAALIHPVRHWEVWAFSLLIAALLIAAYWLSLTSSPSTARCGAAAQRHENA